MLRIIDEWRTNTVQAVGGVGGRTGDIGSENASMIADADTIVQRDMGITMDRLRGSGRGRKSWGCKRCDRESEEADEYHERHGSVYESNRPLVARAL